jgi:hypothetical protein
MARPTPPRRAFALASFSIGGQLVVMLPRYQVKTIEHSSPADETIETEFGFGTSMIIADETDARDASTALAGTVDIYSLTSLLSQDSRARSLADGFIGPLDPSFGPTKSEVIRYAEHVAQQYEQSYHFRTLALLWRILAVACRHNGRLTASSNQATDQHNQLENFV